jgi:hypothetical protein
MISLQFLHLVQIPSGIFTCFCSTGAIGAFCFLNQDMNLSLLKAENPQQNGSHEIYFLFTGSQPLIVN